MTTTDCARELLAEAEKLLPAWTRFAPDDGRPAAAIAAARAALERPNEETSGAAYGAGVQAVNAAGSSRAAHTAAVAAYRAAWAATTYAREATARALAEGITS